MWKQEVDQIHQVARVETAHPDAPQRARSLGEWPRSQACQTEMAAALRVVTSVAVAVAVAVVVAVVAVVVVVVAQLVVKAVTLVAAGLEEVRLSATHQQLFWLRSSHRIGHSSLS